MTNWDTVVVTDSGFYKKVRVENYITQSDAETAALSITGGKKVLYCTPSAIKEEQPEYHEDDVVENHHYYYDSDESSEEDYYHQQLDEMETEMYDLMCRIAMEEGKELPTIEEFYDYLNKE